MSVSIAQAESVTDGLVMVNGGSVVTVVRLKLFAVGWARIGVFVTVTAIGVADLVERLGLVGCGTPTALPAMLPRNFGRSGSSSESAESASLLVFGVSGSVSSAGLAVS